jgi:hypothetical protein
MAGQAVQSVACVNNAGFVMSFGITVLDTATITEHAVEGVDSGNYPIVQTRTIDLATIGIEEGTILWPRVHAVGGRTERGDDGVRYAQNGQTATYEVSGTTLDFDVRLIGG